MRISTENALGPFDRSLWRARRDRAAATLPDADFLLRETEDRIVERLGDIKREFRTAAIIGTGDGLLAATLRGQFGIEHLLQVDSSPKMAAHAAKTAPHALSLVADEEALPFAEASLDLIIAPLTLHWTNDLPGTLIQMRRALKPDGLLMAALFAGSTLQELRTHLTHAEVETTGGLSPRIAPMADLRDLGGLLQRAGLALPVADREVIPVSYSNPLRLLSDLRAMGESNVMRDRHKAPLRRDTLARMLELYAGTADANGNVTATFEVAFLHGWAPAPTQQQPLRPGSAKMRLADALGTEEQPTGEKPGP
jgi:ubiquinone/menaquinone biosynthesis C-methylase UbiE